MKEKIDYWKNVKFMLFKIRIKGFFSSIRRKIWNKRILLWWSRLWVRKDEFHPSLDMSLGAMLDMNDEEREEYTKDLIRRRQIAHERDLNSD